MIPRTGLVTAVEATQPIGQGQQITQADLREVQVVADSGISYVPWSQATAVIRYFAATGIPAGTLLTPAMVAVTGHRVGSRG